MIAPLVFSDRKMILAMQKLHVAMDMVCNSVGDVSLGEHALLANISELESNFLLKWIKANFERFDNPLQYVELLEKKELITRFRSVSDRRGFALKDTSKGGARLALVDEAIAVVLIFTNKRWSEAEFEYLVAKAHSLPNAHAAPRRISTIFPGAFLSLVHKYHQIVVAAAAHYGMTSLQIVLLCAFEDTDTACSFDHFERQSSMPGSVIEFQMEDLAKKDLVHIDQSIELTKKGSQRIGDFSRRVSSQLDSLFSSYSEKDVVSLEDLGEYCIYLFT